MAIGVAAAAIQAYGRRDVAEAICYCEQALALSIRENAKWLIYQKLACMYHAEALGTNVEADRQAYLDKATTAFGEAVALGSAPGADLLTAYANFLLDTGRVAEAHKYLVQAIESGDGESALHYGMIERATVSPLLRERIEQDKGSIGDRHNALLAGMGFNLMLLLRA